MIRPQKLVTPVSDKVQYTHQAKVDTHSLSDSESKHSKGPRKAKSKKRKNKKQITTITTNRNGCRKAQIRARNEKFLYILEPTKKDN